MSSENKATESVTPAAGGTPTAAPSEWGHPEAPIVRGGFGTTALAMRPPSPGGPVPTVFVSDRKDRATADPRYGFFSFVFTVADGVRRPFPRFVDGNHDRVVWPSAVRARDEAVDLLGKWKVEPVEVVSGLGF